MINEQPVDVFCASIGRPDALNRMIASVRAGDHPARVLVAAGDVETIRVCEQNADVCRCVYSSRANERPGCTASLNLVFRELVEHDALFCTDDIRFEPRAISTAMATLYGAFPDGDGVVGLCQSNIPQGYDLAFPLMGARFLERFRPGDLFFPGYFHQYNDAELGVTVKAWGNWLFEPNARLEHDHPCATGLPPDETFRRARLRKGDDDRLWEQRRARGEVWAAERFPELAAVGR
jgi:hypothetical protein